jgi:hypothetical protein
MNTELKYTSWKSAARHVGLLFMIWERFFYLASFLSPFTFFTRIVQKSRGEHRIEFSALWKDWYKLLFFLIIGVITPVMLMCGVDVLPHRIFLIPALYIMFLVLQHHANLTLFNDFRTERLPCPPKGGPFWQKLERAITVILPLDSESSHMERYVITRGRRRIILTLMDFWLVFVCFAVFYWAGIPGEFTPPLDHFVAAFYLSIVTGTTLGYGDIIPITIWAQLLTALEVLLCFLFAFIIIADTVVLLPEVRNNKQ